MQASKHIHKIEDGAGGLWGAVVRPAQKMELRNLAGFAATIAQIEQADAVVSVWAVLVNKFHTQQSICLFGDIV